MSCIITLKNPALMRFPHMSCFLFGLETKYKEINQFSVYIDYCIEKQTLVGHVYYKSNCFTCAVSHERNIYIKVIPPDTKKVPSVGIASCKYHTDHDKHRANILRNDYLYCF